MTVLVISQAFYNFNCYTETMMKAEIGKRLQECRKAAGYTQAQVAERLNTTQPVYARYESGVLELDYGKMIFLCELFDASADYILVIKKNS